jgi:hypothetical protein
MLHQNLGEPMRASFESELRKHKPGARPLLSFGRTERRTWLRSNQTLSSHDPVQSGGSFTRVLLECSILPAVLALVARARPPAIDECRRAAIGCQLPEHEIEIDLQRPRRM